MGDGKIGKAASFKWGLRMLPIIPGARWLWILLSLMVAASALAVQTARLKAAQKSEAAMTQVAAQWRMNFEAMDATNSANVKALEKLYAENKRIAALASAARSQNKQLAVAYENLRKDLSHASYESSVNPGFCRVFDELRRLQGQTGPACGH